MANPLLGAISPVSFNFAPKGYAQCDGQALPISQNAALYQLLGTTYGGDGVHTFALPDLRGRVAMHVGNGHVLGERGGETAHTLATNELAGHTHSVGRPASKDEETTNRPDGAYFTKGGAYGGTADAAHPMGATTSSSAVGGGQSHTNVQPVLALNFVIALSGDYPS